MTEPQIYARALRIVPVFVTIGGAPRRNQPNQGRALDIPSARDVRRRHARLEGTMLPNEYEILVRSGG